jgi:hypothetical protein
MKLGPWAGADVEIVVAADSAVFTSSRCITGYMKRPILDSRGHFISDAAMQAMIGPPPAPPLPHAIVSGRVNGDVLTFTATYDNGMVLGPLTATFNADRPPFFPCPP